MTEKRADRRTECGGYLLRLQCASRRRQTSPTRPRHDSFRDAGAPGEIAVTAFPVIAEVEGIGGLGFVPAEPDAADTGALGADVDGKGIGGGKAGDLGALMTPGDLRFFAGQGATGGVGKEDVVGRADGHREEGELRG
jgi:hypothetical protein